MSLSIMTWNIRHGLGDDKIQDISRICFDLKKRESDVVAIQEIDRFAKRSKGVDQVSFIENELGYYSSFAKFFNHKTGGEYGLATFTKYPILTSEVLNLNPKSQFGNNKALYVTFEVEGIKINHYNFHFPSKRNVTYWNNFNQIEFPKNSILSGDFNLNPDSTDITRLKSVWNDINEQDTHPVYNILDYNFSDLTPLESRVYESIASDHSMLETKYYL